MCSHRHCLSPKSTRDPGGAPPAGLAPALARFSGPWIFPNAPHRQLVVQSINETWALILQREPEGHWTRIAASVRRDGTVRWGAPDRYALRWAETGPVLDYEGPQGSDRIALQRPPGNGPVFLDTRTAEIALD